MSNCIPFCVYILCMHVCTYTQYEGIHTQFFLYNIPPHVQNKFLPTANTIDFPLLWIRFICIILMGGKIALIFK